MRADRNFYRATKGGCVVDARGGVIYERLPSVPARAIATVLNDYVRDGRPFPDWDTVAEELRRKGILKES